jgi:hypothetical protein
VLRSSSTPQTGAFLRALWRTEVVVILCLVAYALLFAVGIAILEAGRPSIHSFLDRILIVASLTLLFGAVPAMILFAPVYAAARTWGTVNMAAAVVMGIASSMVSTLFSADLRGIAILAVVASALVSAATHVVVAKWR